MESQTIIFSSSIMDPSEELEIEEVYKRGGKRRKAPKRKRRVRKQADVGDTVYLLPGNAPRHYQTERRLATPGQLYSELPKVLRPQSYGAAPSAYRPMTQHEFISAGDKMYGRGRNFYDDIMTNVNPSNIQPNKVPSKRIVQSSNKNTDPTVNQPIMSSLPFRGDTPTIHLTADRTPSMRAAPSQPSPAAFVGVHYAMPSGAAMEQYASQMEQQAALQSMIESRTPARPRAAAKPKLWSGIQSHIASAKEKFATKAELEEAGYKSHNEVVKAYYQEAKNEYPSQKDLNENDFEDYDEAVEFMMANMKRGGIRRRGRGGY
jgi:hypothetical protein